MKEKILERLIGIVTALFVFLLYNYMGSFVTKAEFNLLQKDLEHIKNALCIIDDRTCKIK